MKAIVFENIMHPSYARKAIIDLREMKTPWRYDSNHSHLNLHFVRNRWAATGYSAESKRAHLSLGATRYRDRLQIYKERG